MSIIHSIYDEMKDVWFVRKVYTIYKKIERHHEKKVSSKNLYRVSSASKSESHRIKVAFLTQYIPAWNKFDKIYQIMDGNEEFEPLILCIPNKLESLPQENEVYDWFKSKGYSCVNAKVGSEKWFDLSGIKPDYVFYTRPYNHFLPRIYNSDSVGKYSKVCSVLYGMNMRDTGKENTVINWNFYKDCYCFYASSLDEKDFFDKYIKHCENQKSVFLGYPGLTEVYNFDYSDDNGSWTSKHTKYRLMWTPRWSTDPKIGGSNFFTYKDELLDWADDDAELEFLLRPHPLTFLHFIETGEMTEQEAEEYKNRCASTENTILDESKEYIASFWHTDVLVSDLSGVLYEYFITGKPIIFCPPYNMNDQKFLETFMKIMEGFYFAYNIKDIKEIVGDLRNGIDPLKDRRQKIIEELWGDKLENCPQLIVDDIKRDFQSMEK